MSCSTKVWYQHFSDSWVERNDNFPTSPTGLFGALSLNFIQLLRDVITPSVTEGVITTRGNRMKCGLWSTVLGKLNPLHI